MTEEYRYAGWANETPSPTDFNHHEYGMQHGHARIAENTVCIDFDGTLYPFGPLMGEGPAEPDAIHVMTELKAAGYRIVILTSRLSQTWLKDAGEDYVEQLQHVKNMLDRDGIPYDFLTSEKVPALAYVDDHAIEYNGNWLAIRDRLLGLKIDKDKHTHKFGEFDEYGVARCICGGTMTQVSSDWLVGAVLDE